MELDHMDYQILQLLSENSRIQWKDLGEKVHMTGQAVGNRIKKLEENGVIKAYSLFVEDVKIGLSCTAFVIVYMKTANHDAFVHFLRDRQEIVEAHRISGEGCYHLKVKLHAQNHLNELLNQILEYGNYMLNLSIQEVKNCHTLSARQT
ncbi:winged helix-turn-helix transcriptional regulator [Domibacillus sp. 8LH]|uniref:Lrp/AsnC family transcriptional regulator n=1 Tax=Domibacillus sp. 8LH TaxID=3073900 RepID=UPI00317173BE